MVESGQFIPIVVFIGDSKIAFVHPSGETPGRVVQLTGVLFIPGLQTNLFSLRGMEAIGYSFHERDSEISLFGGKLVFPLKGNL